MPEPAAAAQRAEFRVRADRGFRAAFEVRRRKARLIVHRRFGSMSLPAGSVVAYVSRGSIVRYRVRARFGDRGKVSVRFKPRKTVKRRPPSHCKGPPTFIRTGVFVGTIRFHGERGYTAVNTSRAQGKLRTITHWKCKRKHPPSRDLEAEFEAVSAYEKPVVLETRGGRNLFRAAADRSAGDKGLTLFTAGRGERRSRMHILRWAYAYGSNRTFDFDQGLTWATFEPPQPFGGSARFSRGTHGPSWTGSLRVDLPGAETARLAGKGYGARLYRGKPEDSPGY